MSQEAATELGIEEVGRPGAKSRREKTVMVSARIPSGLRDRVNDLLRKRGITQTDLIVAAYTYFYETGELPEDPSKPRWGEHRRVPAPEEVEQFKAHMRGIACHVRPECEDWDFDRMKFEAMRERYPEHLGAIEREEDR